METTEQNVENSTKKVYGEKMVSSLVLTSKSLKDTLLAMQEFTSVYGKELKDKLQDTKITDAQRAEYMKELNEINRPEVQNIENVVKQIDEAMSHLQNALVSAFKIKK